MEESNDHIDMAGVKGLWGVVVGAVGVGACAPDVVLAAVGGGEPERVKYHVGVGPHIPEPRGEGFVPAGWAKGGPESLEVGELLGIRLSWIQAVARGSHKASTETT